ncbi:hypothetical protein B0H11DRAFT_2304442 [Mycena galericulata]|nr:hypothetical protein B0H11DRAFT_2304442 [Mycena galericulata]
MLFNDDIYDAPDALVFNWGPVTFKYNRSSLQDVIVKQMEDENWMGACCEPNCLIAMRYNDVRAGSNVVGPALAKYTAAWGFNSATGFLPIGTPG